MRRSMANENELEIVPRLHFLLSLILALAKIATMVGLFFTVISMINTFNAIGEQRPASGEGEKSAARLEDRSGGALRDRVGANCHGDSAGIQSRAVQGVIRAIESEDEVRHAHKLVALSSPTTRRDLEVARRETRQGLNEEGDYRLGFPRRDRAEAEGG